MIDTPALRFGRAARALHALDFGHLLPALAALPPRGGLALAQARAVLRAQGLADWRSLALGYRHVAARTLQAYDELRPQAGAAQRRTWLRRRYLAEARDELEARWIAAGRVAALPVRVVPGSAALPRPGQPQVWLASHWHSFFIGIAFLARGGATVNVMTSAVTSHPLVTPQVAAHFRAKYGGMARWLNGGRLLDFEGGLRPFFRMLEQGQTVVVLADAPVLPQGARLEVPFLGQRRALAGGAVRLAQRTGSLLGAYTCEPADRPGGRPAYRLALAPVGPAADPAQVEAAYAFLGAAIERDPGGWWAADLLPDMPPVAAPAP